jgi:hypothetical protein
MFLLGFYSIIILPLVTKKLSIPLSILLFASYTVDQSYFCITGKPASLTTVSMLNAAAGNITDAFYEYKNIILKSLLLSLLLFVPIFINIYLIKKIIKKLWIIIPICILFLFYLSILVYKGEPALMGFPKGFSYTFHSIVLKANSLYVDLFNSPKYLVIKKFDGIKFNKIVVIIDESVEYSYFKKINTIQSEFLFNFGQSYSGANCSASSNYILRRAKIRAIDNSSKLLIEEVSSLFKLAKDNKYKTIYVDNQNVLNDNAVNNYFDRDEVKEIDNIINFNALKFDKDRLSLNLISDLLNNNDKIFIMINKIGAHFPYESSIPDSYRSNSRESNYITSIQLNSIDFLANILKIIDKNTIIFYTSDHGQDLQSKTTHCNSGDDINIKEYSVPFVIITRNQIAGKFFQDRVLLFANKLTHIDFSESVRNVMGYQIDGISSPIKDIFPDEHFCGLYGQPKIFFGVLPSCKMIK